MQAGCANDPRQAASDVSRVVIGEIVSIEKSWRSTRVWIVLARTLVLV